ncbi:formin-like protein 2, partial [Tanacetum coccineum]
VNEEMMETLFMANSSKPAPNHRTNQPVAANMNQKMRVLDPHKSRNIAILLRAFNLTIDEVCESILQGNVDTLGSELLGSLLKMTPTVDEEIQLKELNDTSLVELDPAEKFLKAVIDIPFAFKRVDAMLYISNFDTEVEYLKASFETIKVLRAVLQGREPMIIGTNRGDAQAFKLDTLLKLIDIKGTDGKTTLLHFVVHEITKAESRLSGLAAIDYDILSKEVGKLAMGLTKIREVVALNEQSCSNDSFLDSMTMFLRKAEADIVNIKDEERVTLLMVKDITEYFHGS